MVHLTRIYTRGGDTGQTSLGDGSRVPKYDLRIATLGAVDEANATIGVARLSAQPDLDRILARIQNDLFDLGADLCAPEDPAHPRLRVAAAQVAWLETTIDTVNGALGSLDSFILPGGTPAAAHLHLARAVVRHAERLMAELAVRDHLNPDALRYINRLSDLLFVLARHANDRGKADVLWTPGANR